MLERRFRQGLGTLSTASTCFFVVILTKAHALLCKRQLNCRFQKKMPCSLHNQKYIRGLGRIALTLGLKPLCWGPGTPYLSFRPQTPSLLVFGPAPMTHLIPAGRIDNSHLLDLCAMPKLSYGSLSKRCPASVGASYEVYTRNSAEMTCQSKNHEIRALTPTSSEAEPL